MALVCTNPALADWSLSGAAVGMALGKDISLLAEAGVWLSAYVMQEN